MESTWISSPFDQTNYDWPVDIEIPPPRFLMGTLDRKTGSSNPTLYHRSLNLSKLARWTGLLVSHQDSCFAINRCLSVPVSTGDSKLMEHGHEIYEGWQQSSRTRCEITVSLRVDVSTTPTNLSKVTNATALSFGNNLANGLRSCCFWRATIVNDACLLSRVF